jgi:hypothetical protein
MQQLRKPIGVASQQQRLGARSNAARRSRGVAAFAAPAAAGQPQPQPQQPQQQHQQDIQLAATSRRQLLTGSGAAAFAAAVLPQITFAGPVAASAQGTQVGSYLPPSGVDNLVLFVPDGKKVGARFCPCIMYGRSAAHNPRRCSATSPSSRTPSLPPPPRTQTPAIRAATVSPSSPYRFAMPPTWREAKVANILSGNVSHAGLGSRVDSDPNRRPESTSTAPTKPTKTNPTPQYCQPRCAEPWIEVIFENEAEGKAQVIVAPLVRLTNRKGVTIEDIGPPSGIITSLGPFITGVCACVGGRG